MRIVKLVNIKTSPFKNPIKDIYLIDFNVYILLGYNGCDDRKIGYRNIIIDKIKGKLVSPILYLAEKLFHTRISEGSLDEINEEVNKFIHVIGSNSDATPDQSLLNHDMKKNYCEMINEDSNSNYYNNVRFLKEFYNDILYSEEFSLINNMGNTDKLSGAFSKFIELDVSGVDKIVVLSSLISLFSLNSEETCFYELFKRKKCKDVDSQINNVLGDLRNIRYILYATSYIPDFVTLKFLTNDSALFRVIKELNISMEVNSEASTYHFNNIDFSRIINKNYQSLPLYEDFKSYISALES